VRTIAILPVKSFGSAKQRLAGAAGERERASLARAMLSDVLEALGRVERVETVAVVTADPAAALEASGRGARLVQDTRESGQSDAAAAGIAEALATGFERVLLVPGDTPLLDPEEVDELLRDEETAVTIVPDRHGTGTNALVLRPPDALAPAFGLDSMRRHVAAAGPSHRVAELPSLALDLDTPDDLAALEAALRSDPLRAPATHAALLGAGSRVGA
jgi:2-phospho-L-lactate/phosphoenolpyruvate guanylyltransferase